MKDLFGAKTVFLLGLLLTSATLLTVATAKASEMRMIEQTAETRLEAGEIRQ